MSDEPPKKHSSHHPPPPPSLSSLPEEIVLRCLAFVPRSYRLSLSWVSKELRSLLRSPELNGLRPDKNSLYVCFLNKYNDPTTVHWFTLRPNEETTTTEYVLVPNPTPFPPHKYGSNKRFHEEIQVEVFDPKSGTWELAGVENVRKTLRCGASVDRKVYMVESEETGVYNPRGCERERMVNERLSSERGRKEALDDTVCRACVVEDVLFAFFVRSGVMWFNTKFNAWSSLVGPDGKELFISRADAMSEYDDDGRLAVLYMLGENEVDETFTKSVGCMLVKLDRAGEKICGTIDWSGVVGAVPYWFSFLHCFTCL
ncbi:putative F-box/kelch-repeat protein At2g41360 [Brassica napus]|uniref:F-box domain-containing protein n=2 Tax=Brassica TaxID=3705 RepID=A0A8S9Q2D6_BRACR|nr:putative F-box/kelch-repeat protein At2g41360 [Brassica napus]KAF3524836.1 hypothetical protein F2Q69_00051690 [Brassica cretica]CAF2065108.1 unnamed protein product [Brassica napus]